MNFHENDSFMKAVIGLLKAGTRYLNAHSERAECGGLTAGETAELVARIKRSTRRIHHIPTK